MSQRLRSESNVKFETAVDRLKITPQVLKVLSHMTQGDSRKALTHISDDLVHVATALTGKRYPFSQNGSFPISVQAAFEALYSTGLLVGEMPKNSMGGAISFEMSKPRHFFEDGIMTMDLEWHGTRIIEIGFMVDENCNLVVANCQRHRLGRVMRSPIDDEMPSLEKTMGDQMIRDIEHDTGLPIEFLGAIVGALSLSDTMDKALPHWSGDVLFTEFEQKKEIANTLESHRYLIGDHKTVSELDRYRQFMDYRLMLQRLGLKSISNHSQRFLGVKRHALKNAFQSYFTDDQSYPERHRYRKEIYRMVKP